MEIEIFESKIVENTLPTSAERDSHLLAATTLIGEPVRNCAGESLGNIEDIVIDVLSGQIAYAVLSFGGFLGVGNKFFAIPFQLLHTNDDRSFTLNVEKQVLKNAPGFDKSNWPDFTNEDIQAQISVYYGASPFFDEPPRH